MKSQETRACALRRSSPSNSADDASQQAAALRRSSPSNSADDASQQAAATHRNCRHCPNQSSSFFSLSPSLEPESQPPACTEPADSTSSGLTLFGSGSRL